MLREITFEHARVIVVITPLKSFVRTEFEDGMNSLFVPPWQDPQFCKHAAWAGYGDPVQYGIEHDIAHSFIADRMGYKVSRVVWADCHGGTEAARAAEDKSVYPTLDDEEHLANRLQRWVNTGAEDEHHVIDNVFDPIGGLIAVGMDFMLTARPWLRGR